MNNILYGSLLVTGAVDQEGYVVDGSLSPLVKSFVAIGNSDGYDILKTNENGVICTIGAKSGKQQLLIPFQSKLD